MSEKKKLVTANIFGDEDTREKITPNHRTEKTPPAEPVTEKPKQETPVAENPIPDKQEPGVDLLSGIVQTKAKKNVSFYLEDDIVVALDKLAKQKKTTRSILLNTLLKNYLLNK